jgi:hypothetical protein
MGVQGAEGRALGLALALWSTYTQNALYQPGNDQFEPHVVAKWHPGSGQGLRAELEIALEVQEQRGLEFDSGMKVGIGPQTFQDLRDLGYTGKD